MIIATPTPIKYTVVLAGQGAVTLPSPPTPFSTAVVKVAGLANTTMNFQSSQPGGWAQGSYDSVAGNLTVSGIAGDTVVWQAWTLTVAP